MQGETPSLLALLSPRRGHHGRTRSDDSFGVWRDVLDGSMEVQGGLQEWQV